MPRKRAIWWARWLFLPAALTALVVLVPGVFAFVKERFLQSADYVFWPNADFWVPCLGGVVCGGLWVVLVFRLAPAWKRGATVVSLLPGAWLAWMLIGETTWHVGDDWSGAGFATRAPVYATWWGGLVGLLLVWCRGRPEPAGAAVPAEGWGGRLAGWLALVAAVLLCGGLVLPALIALGQWTLYETALRTIVRGDKPTALRQVRRLARTPGFDLDWAPGCLLKRIPGGYTLDERRFGCPSCRNIHTPLLSVAARYGHADLVEGLVRRRGSVAYGDDRGLTLLQAAITSGDVAVVDRLLGLGADVTATNGFGGGVHQAVLTRASDTLLERLLQAGAPVNGRTRIGMTPLDCAQVWNPAAVELLRRHGATNAAIRVQLLPVPGAEGLFSFEGTPFRIRLPPTFSPCNRRVTPPEGPFWYLESARRSSLTFGVGRKLPAAGTPTNFCGFAASVAHDEYTWNDSGWSASGCIVFDTSSRTPGATDTGRAASYDAEISYHAMTRGDLHRIREALRSFQLDPATGERGLPKSVPAQGPGRRG